MSAVKKRGGKQSVLAALPYILAVVILGFVVWAVGNFAAGPRPVTFYVSPSGSDENSGHKESKPRKSIQNTLELAQPGDTVVLADGQYAQRFESARAGTEARPITIKGGQGAVISGSGNNGRVIEIFHDHIHLDGFLVNGKIGEAEKRESYRDKLIYVSSKTAKKGVEGLKIRGLTVENAGGECIRLRYFAKNNEISNSTIRNCGIYDFKLGDSGKNGEGIYIGTAPEQRKDGNNPTADPDESSNNWIHHNTIETHGNECVDVKEAAHHNLIEHNVCRFQMDPDSGGMDARGDDNTFRYNKISENVGAGVRLGGDEETDGVRNNVYGNEIFGNRGPAVKIIRQPQGTICTDQDC